MGTAEQFVLDRQQVQLTDVTNKVSEMETQLSDSQSRLATVRASWRQLSFPGDPTAEVAGSREAQLESSVTELARHSDTLQTIKIEIGDWSKLEQARLSQGLLDRRRGPSSEEAFTNNYQKRIDREQSSQNRLSLLCLLVRPLSVCGVTNAGLRAWVAEGTSAAN